MKNTKLFEIKYPIVLYEMIKYPIHVAYYKI
jgi:hypothetical protein